MRSPSRWLAVGLATVIALLSLLPLASLAATWWAYARDVGLPLTETSPLGYDGVQWQDDRGRVVAGYVVPCGSASRSGVATGDELRQIDFLPVETARDAEQMVDRATGTVLTYSLRRGGQPLRREVRVQRTPTFLYPLTPTLWSASGWGFGVVALLHLVAYLTVAPLAARSVRARRSRMLIGAALLWVAGNLLRVGWVASLGAPPAGATLRGGVFDALTLVALGGWITYPALLLDQSLRTRAARMALGQGRWIVALPPLVLGIGVLAATVLGHIGPLPPDAFAVPILFYVCVYVAAATGIVAIQGASAGVTPVWSRLGSAVVLVLAGLGAAVALAQLDAGPRDTQVTSAWFVVLFQLFSVLPVALVSFAVLRHGPFDVLLARTLATLGVFGVAFAIVTLGSAALDAVLPGGSQPLALGALVVLVLLAGERLAPTLRDRAQSLLRTQRQRARRRLERLGARIQTVVDVQALAEVAVDTIGEALESRSAVVFLQQGTERWVSATYRPESPTFTSEELDLIWGRIRDEGHIWSRNDELNESAMPRATAERLRRLGAALAVPVTTGRGQPVGLLVLGRKVRRLGVYNTEDVDRLRAVAVQLALATERLRLLDRERELVRQTAQAELVALRAQINPHFLFNALNTVAALIRDRPDQAEATVEHLAGLFRDVLSASGQSTISLADELRLVRRYLFVEQARFGDALTVEIDVADDLAGRAIPAFAVQTLVENAVKHGIERQRGGGRVTVAARRAASATDAPQVEITVDDTGVGLAPGTPYGVGLQNVADRLRLLHADRATLDVRRTDTGTRSTLRLPLDD